jgi:bifunctional non-homologous end joining protein LigD
VPRASNGPGAGSTVEIEGRVLKVSNLDKVLWPETGFTKGQMIDYYAKIGETLLPHLQGRPLTLKRYPNGVAESFFYEKQCPSHRPDWVSTCPIGSRGVTGKTINYCLANDLPTLIWVANLASIELHPLLALGGKVDHPTMVAFDLDPGAPADLIDCCEVGLWVKDVLDGLGLQSFPKTSGSKGLQLYVPLNTPHTYDQTKPFAHAIARLLEKQHPDRVVERMEKELRGGKVLIDWSQNHITKTTICVYSLRARPRPTVSTPVTWDEVAAALDARDPSLLTFEAPAVLDRVKTQGDLFRPVLELEQHLPEFG